MLLKDGTALFYTIQFQPPPGTAGGWDHDEWSFINFKGFSTLEEYPGLLATHREHPLYEFTAKGSCWQETGHYGVYSEAHAVHAARALKRNKRGYKFRIAAIQIEQKTEVIPV